MTIRPELTKEWINRTAREGRALGIVSTTLGLVPSQVTMGADEVTFDITIPCNPLSKSKNNPLETLSLEDASKKLSAAMATAVNAKNEPLGYRLGTLKIEPPKITHPALAR